MKKLVSLLMLVLLMFATPAFADKCKNPVAVTSPCEGVLVPATAAAEALHCMEVDLPNCRDDVAKVSELRAAEATSNKNVLDAERLNNVKTNALLDKCLGAPKPEGQMFWETPVFLISVGLVAGIAGTITVVHFTK